MADLNERITKNFVMKEFVRSAVAEEKCIDNTIPDDCAENIRTLCVECLQPIRDTINRSMTITSGFRSEVLNRAVNGAYGSDHCLGRAADFVVGGREDNLKAFAAIKKSGIEFDQLINERDGSWIHVSYRKGNNRNQVLNLS
jgi:hypothetical protein